MSRVIGFSVSGDTKKTQKFLQSLQKGDMYSGLEGIARRGVAALQASTPTDSGLTGASWSYEIVKENGGISIYWLNSNRQNGANIAILLQYGHSTGTGGFVSGRDYINPAIKPIFDEIASEVWKKVTSA